MKRLSCIVLIATGILFNSCATTNYSSNNSYKSKYLNIKCFQALSNTSEYSSCLARDYDFNVYYIVNFTCPGKSKYELYYDDKSITGYYVFVGTYTYETREERQKTVQAYMPKDNFYELYNYDRTLLKGYLDIVLSYNVIE